MKKGNDADCLYAVMTAGAKQLLLPMDASLIREAVLLSTATPVDYSGDRGETRFDIPLPLPGQRGLPVVKISLTAPLPK